MELEIPTAPGTCVPVAYLLPTFACSYRGSRLPRCLWERCVRKCWHVVTSVKSVIFPRDPIAVILY